MLREILADPTGRWEPKADWEVEHENQAGPDGNQTEKNGNGTEPHGDTMVKKSGSGMELHGNMEAQGRTQTRKTRQLEERTK